MKAPTIFASALCGTALLLPAAYGQAVPMQGGGSGSSGTRTAPGQSGLDRIGVNAAGPNSASFQDKDFLRKAAQGSNFEIKAGQLAQQKSTSDDVKQFGQKMVEDHTKLNQEMAPIAVQAGVAPPTGISKKDQKLYDTLAGKSGADFDNAYIAHMVEDHTEDLKEFKKEADSGQLQPEKDAASKNVPVIQGHLQAAQQMAQAHNVPLNGKGL